MVADQKKALRKTILNSEILNREEKDKSITSNLLKILESYKTLISYSPIKGEVDITSVNQEFADKKSLYLPRVFGREMQFYKVLDIENYTIGSFGIKEPISDETLIDTENTACLVPALCFDKRFKRLGRGGGYYDRFLEGYKGFTIGICYSEFLLPMLPTESFDRAVDMIVSDRDIYKRK